MDDLIQNTMDDVVAKLSQLHLELRTYADHAGDSDIAAAADAIAREAQYGTHTKLAQLLLRVASIPVLQDEIVQTAREIADGLRGGDWTDDAIDEPDDSADLEDDRRRAALYAEAIAEIRGGDDTVSVIDTITVTSVTDTIADTSVTVTYADDDDDTDSVITCDSVSDDDVDDTDIITCDSVSDDEEETECRFMLMDTINIYKQLVEEVRAFEDLDSAIDDLFGSGEGDQYSANLARVEVLYAAAEDESSVDIDFQSAWEEVDAMIDEIEGRYDTEPLVLEALRKDKLFAQAQCAVGDVSDFPNEELITHWGDICDTRSSALAEIERARTSLDTFLGGLRKTRPDLFPGGQNYDEVCRRHAELAALEEIRVEQGRADNVLDPNAFELLVREIGQDFVADLKWTPEAIQALQAVAEAHLVEVFKDASLEGIHAGRTYIRPYDIWTARRVRGDLG